MKISFLSFSNCAMLLFIAQLFSSCAAQKTCRNCGIVVVKSRYFDATSQQYIRAGHDRDFSMWYKDSMVIQEVEHIYQNTALNGDITFKVLVERYKFINLRTREIYEYSNFSDTAKLIKKCLPNDSSCIGECWKFWNGYEFMSIGKLSNLPDTVIDNINYKKIESTRNLDTEKGKIIFSVIGYFRCDMKNGLFKFSPKFSEKIGCPLVMFQEFNNPSVYQNMAAEIDYLPRKLTKEELKVFAAWEKNAKEYNAGHNK